MVLCLFYAEWVRKCWCWLFRCSVVWVVEVQVSVPQCWARCCACCGGVGWSNSVRAVVVSFFFLVLVPFWLVLFGLSSGSSVVAPRCCLQCASASCCWLFRCSAVHVLAVMILLCLCWWRCFGTVCVFGGAGCSVVVLSAVFTCHACFWEADCSVLILAVVLWCCACSCRGGWSGLVPFVIRCVLCVSRCPSVCCGCGGLVLFVFFPRVLVLIVVVCSCVGIQFAS